MRTDSGRATVAVVGGVYRERCLRPLWDEVFGSAGRAATCLAAMGAQATLHAYADEQAQAVLGARAALEPGLDPRTVAVEGSVLFDYVHAMATPSVVRSIAEQAPLRIQADRVLAFGMLESHAIVEAESAVYDPQDAVEPRSFRGNGSCAKRLALVLNVREARLLSRMREASVDALVNALLQMESAEVVIIKQGPHGASVGTDRGVDHVPAHVSERVWKIGSGDCFAAHFAFRWLIEERAPVEAARLASTATAYYAQTRGYPNASDLAEFASPTATICERVRQGYRPKVYLAGPFFNLAQLWLVEQTRTHLQSMGLEVFSPYHDVGYGSAYDVVQPDLAALRAVDAVFAIADGLDAGTVYEIGYARALGHPVIVYSENESEGDLKMIRGSGCAVMDDYVTALYHTVWAASAS